MPRLDLLDTSHLRDEPEYWDALAQRIEAGAIRPSDVGGFDWLSGSRAARVTVGLLVAAALALAVLPDTAPSPSRQRAQWAEMLAPSDELGQAIVVRENPPALGTLLLNRAR